jgi:hypothetical protein
MYDSIHMKFQENANLHLQLPMVNWEEQGLTVRGHKVILKVDRIIQHLGSDGVCKSIYICQKSLNFTLKMGESCV